MRRTRATSVLLAHHVTLPAHHVTLLAHHVTLWHMEAYRAPPTPGRCFMSGRAGEIRIE